MEFLNIMNHFSRLKSELCWCNNCFSSYPSAAPKATFCQWLIKGNEQETIEFEIVDLDLNFENAHPGQTCADSLLVLGVSGLESPYVL